MCPPAFSSYFTLDFHQKSTKHGLKWKLASLSTYRAFEHHPKLHSFVVRCRRSSLLWPRKEAPNLTFFGFLIRLNLVKKWGGSTERYVLYIKTFGITPPFTTCHRISNRSKFVFSLFLRIFSSQNIINFFCCGIFLQQLRKMPDFDNQVLKYSLHKIFSDRPRYLHFWSGFEFPAKS